MRVPLLLIAAFTATQVVAQTPPATRAKSAEASGALAQAVQQASDFRRELVRDIVAGKATPAEAFAKLRVAKSPAGFDFGPEGSVAFAATDIGHNLLAIGKPVEAEFFFTEAEKSLGTAIEKTRDTAAPEKARLHEQRAFLRASYLNKRTGAADDLDEVVRLRPEDKQMRLKRDALRADRGVRPGKKQPKEEGQP